MSAALSSALQMTCSVPFTVVTCLLYLNISWRNVIGDLFMFIIIMYKFYCNTQVASWAASTVRVWFFLCLSTHTWFCLTMFFLWVTVGQQKWMFRIGRTKSCIKRMQWSSMGAPISTEGSVGWEPLRLSNKCRQTRLGFFSEDLIFATTEENCLDFFCRVVQVLHLYSS